MWSTPEEFYENFQISFPKLWKRQCMLLIETSIYKKEKYEKWGKFEELVETAERLFLRKEKEIVRRRDKEFDIQKVED